jgi:hypothetical protein
MRPGINDLYVRLTGKGDSVTIGGVRGGVCVDHVVVGTPAPR